TVPGLSHVVAVAAGDDHSLALLSNGTVMAWGQNTHGELGNGNNTGPDTCGSDPCGTSPVPVSGLSHVVAISAGGFHNLALLAYGTNTGPDTCGAPSNACSTKPIAVGGLSGVASIGAASSYTLARLSNGTLRAWGNNYYGNLGDGTRTNHFSPTPVSGISGAA